MLNHQGTRIIETERLILRPFTMADTEPMFRNWANDPDVCRYMTWPPHENVEVTRELLTRWTGSYGAPDYYNWAIVLKDNGPEPIGNISTAHVTESTLCATMGYCMSKAHWGRGIMAEALCAIVDFFFGQVGFNRIDADHDIENPNSGRVMQKAGMQFEGTMRQAGRNNRGIVDICHWAILRQDWLENRQNRH